MIFAIEMGSCQCSAPAALRISGLVVDFLVDDGQLYSGDIDEWLGGPNPSVSAGRSRWGVIYTESGMLDLLDGLDLLAEDPPGHTQAELKAQATLQNTSQLPSSSICISGFGTITVPNPRKCRGLCGRPI